MTVKIENEYLENLYQGIKVKGKPRFNKHVITGFIKTVDRLKFGDNLADIKAQRSLNFEALKGDLKGKFSVRVDIKYRIILRMEKTG
ncbi:MAG: type II toxin-antitoxin system RelE/ParE family toxin [Bacteroidetes bacterium]|nr:type II toxin-antitoxin system RelE/ParE family toxin [Bacteroidota bacterium]